MSEIYYGYGPAIVNGIVQYLSPSAIEKSNPESYFGCPTRYWFKYVQGLKEPFTGSQKLGKDTHKQIELYLKSSARDRMDSAPVLNALAHHAAHFIPKPDPSYLIESRIQEVNYVPGTADFDSWAHEPLITASGIRMVGEIDLMQPHTGQECTYINELGDLCEDAPYTVQVTDWKTTGSISRNAKTAHGLVKTVQMPTYAKAAITKYPDAQHVRISHVYMQTQGARASKKVTTLLSRAKIESEWARIEDMAANIKLWAAMSEPSQIPKKKVCGTCPFKDVCDKPAIQSLSECFDLVKLPKPKKQKTKGKKMDITDQLDALLDTPAEKTPDTVPYTPPEYPKDFDKVIAHIEGMEKNGEPVGLPKLVGPEAQAFCALKGLPASDTFEGEGQLQNLPNPLTFEQMYKLASIELPDIGAPAEAPKTPKPKAEPETPKAEPEAPKAAPDTAPNTTPTLAEFKKLKKPDMIVAFDKLRSAPPDGDEAEFNRGFELGKAAAGVVNVINNTSQAQSATLDLHINAVPSKPFDRLDAYMNDILRKLEEKTGAKDIRCSDHALLGFGKWKGAVSAMVRESPPEPGVYVIFTGTELLSEFADAIKSVSDTFEEGTRGER